MEQGRIVVASYKPMPGKEEALDILMKDHLPILKSQGLITDRASIIMKSSDGTVIEVFEWKSAEAIAGAHTNPVVQKMWADYAEVCEYVPFSTLPEANQLFADFTPF